MPISEGVIGREVDNTLLHLYNSSYPTQPRSLIANYYNCLQRPRFASCFGDIQKKTQYKSRVFSWKSETHRGNWVKRADISLSMKRIEESRQNNSER